MGSPPSRSSSRPKQAARRPPPCLVPGLADAGSPTPSVVRQTRQWSKYGDGDDDDEEVAMQLTAM
eukprot:11164053-Lingulodinium_polyedra.AAC.1